PGTTRATFMPVIPAVPRQPPVDGAPCAVPTPGSALRSCGKYSIRDALRRTPELQPTSPSVTTFVAVPEEADRRQGARSRIQRQQSSVEPRQGGNRPDADRPRIFSPHYGGGSLASCEWHASPWPKR